MLWKAPRSSWGSPISDPDLAAAASYQWIVTRNGVEYATGSENTLHFTPDDNGEYLVTLSVTAEGRGTGTASRTINVTQLPSLSLAVSQLTDLPTGFTLQLSRPFVAAGLNLYDQGGSLGPADVTVIGASTGAVQGSLVVGTDNRITFLKTGGLLAPDTYTVTLAALANGFKDAAANLLDGNGDGTPGDNYRPDLHRRAGPSQRRRRSAFRTSSAASASRQCAGQRHRPFPFMLSTGHNVSQVTMTLRLRSGLADHHRLRPRLAASRRDGQRRSEHAGAGRGHGRARAASSAHGRATRLIRLTAQVPDNAPYGDKEILASDRAERPRQQRHAAVPAGRR